MERINKTLKNQHEATISVNKKIQENRFPTFRIMVQTLLHTDTCNSLNIWTSVYQRVDKSQGCIYWSNAYVIRINFGATGILN
jgi:hypothetical protein